MENYLKRKNEELKFLSSFIDNNFQYTHLISPSSIISIKEQITKEIRNKNSTMDCQQFIRQIKCGQIYIA